MPQLPDAPRCLKLTLNFHQNTKTQIFNRTYFQYTDAAPTITQLQMWGQTALSYFHSDVMPHLTTDFFINSTKVVDLSTTASPEVEYQSPQPGSIAIAPLPPGDCAMIQFHVARRYRGGQPRWYQSGIPTNSVDATGALQQPWAGQFSTAFIAFLNHMAANTWTGSGIIRHVNVSYYKGFTVHTKPGGRPMTIPTPRPTPVIDVVTGTALQPQITSQRRRDLV